MDKDVVYVIYICTHTHTHTVEYGILLSHQKNEILPIATTRMDLEGIILSEISQSEKERYHVISLIYGI